MPDYNGFDPVLAAEHSETAHNKKEEAEKAAARRGKGAKESPFSPEQLRRQGDATRSAFVALGQAGAIAFLNGHDRELGGRPLDIAAESKDGLASVERRLEAMKARV